MILANQGVYTDPKYNFPEDFQISREYLAKTQGLFIDDEP